MLLLVLNIERHSTESQFVRRLPSAFAGAKYRTSLHSLKLCADCRVLLLVLNIERHSTESQVVRRLPSAFAGTCIQKHSKL